MKSSGQNWSGSVEFRPAEVRYPASLEEIATIVKECREKGRGLRVIGSGHSFTPLVATSGVLLSLDNYAGIEQVDREKQQAIVRAGTKIKQLGEELFQHGLAQPNLGDIDVQSIAGAVSTGTHGSGVTLGSLSTQLTGLTLITANGEIIECSEEENRELFKAAQVSFGALGIIARVKLQLVPAYKLHYVWRKMTLNDCLENIEKYKQENRNFEFFWVPHTEAVLAKFMNMTDEAPRPKNLFRQFNEIALENGVLWLLSEFCRLLPSRSVQVSRIIGSLISGGSDVNYSHKIFATPRLVKFQEMEYNLPAQHFVEALREIKATIDQRHFQVHFPIECRFVKEDDILLSPANGRASAYIAVHMYKGMEYRAYFQAMEEIFKKYQGRPHWGKMHTRSAADLKELYSEWERFQVVRQQIDPDGFFLNDHLRTLLEETARVKTV
jgi:FAD-linked oxidoreductase